MSGETIDNVGSQPATSLGYGKIRVRNVWLLFLYAHDLARFHDRFNAEIEDSPDFRCLVARLLCHAVENRLRRNLSYSYRRREDILKRVRGRIDLLKTAAGELLSRGEIACRFDELTIDTPRNRLVCAALDTLGRRLDDRTLAHRSRTLARTLERAGVSDVMPSRAEMTSEQFARHESGDRLMVSLARAVFDLILPTEQEGARTLLEAERDDVAFRKLFEKAVGNFFAAELSQQEGWRVDQSKTIHWPVGTASSGIHAYLPEMITDIVLENKREGRRVIVDTKFTNILTKARYGDGHRFKTDHIYQLYGYLRSQERASDPHSLSAEGMLLYPAVGIDVDEAAEIQGHIVRFVTIDLAAETQTVIENLRRLPVSSPLTLR